MWFGLLTLKSNGTCKIIVFITNSKYTLRLQYSKGFNDSKFLCKYAKTYISWYGFVIRSVRKIFWHAELGSASHHKVKRCHDFLSFL